MCFTARQRERGRAGSGREGEQAGQAGGGTVRGKHEGKSGLCAQRHAHELAHELEHLNGEGARGLGRRDVLVHVVVDLMPPECV